MRRSEVARCCSLTVRMGQVADLARDWFTRHFAQVISAGAGHG